MVSESLRCIIVDDDKNIRELLSEILQLQGYSVNGTAKDGIEGVRLFDKQRPDIVFLDVRMPNMNGIDALKEIRKVSVHAKVIMITADSSNIKKTLLDSGADYVIFKPFKLETIQNALDQITASASIKH